MKKHFKGTNGRTRCGHVINERTEIGNEDTVDCKMCLDRTYHDTAMFLENRELKKRIAELESCPHCGTTEFLCGHNGVGCTSKMEKELEEEIEEQEEGAIFDPNTDYDKDTLGYHYSRAKWLFGGDSQAIKYLEDQASESKEGYYEKILQDERQVVQLLFSLHTGKTKRIKEIRNRKRP